MNGRTSGTFTRMGPARAKAQRERLMYVLGGSAMAFLVLFALVLLSSKSTVQASSAHMGENLTAEASFGHVVLLAPSKQVPKGAKLGRIPLEEVFWQRDKVPQGAVRSVEDIKDMYAKAPLIAGQPILFSSLTATAPNYGIMDQLPPGHRAVTIAVDETAGVEGWATPGAHVDVLVTYDDRQSGQSVSRIAVEDAIVLSYDGSTNVKSPDGEIIDTRAKRGNSTVTLMVSLEETLQLQTAKHMGRINLVLRHVSDPTAVTSYEFSSNNWGKAQVKKEESKKNLGFVKFSDEDGNDKTFVVKEDNSWWEAGEDEDDEDFGE